MNELVNFARQALGRRPTGAVEENRSVTGPTKTEHRSDWLTRWRNLAQMTSGLLPDDPRVSPVLSALADCDRCYKTQDLDAFTKSAARVRRLMLFAPGARVWWEGAANHRLTVLGPATVETVHSSDGRLWVWIEWDDQGRWVSDAIIQRMEGPTS